MKVLNIDGALIAYVNRAELARIKSESNQLVTGKGPDGREYTAYMASLNRFSRDIRLFYKGCVVVDSRVLLKD